MKDKARLNAKRASNKATRFISTGEVFAGGATIELVSGSSRFNKPNVLLWNGGKATVGPSVKYGDCIYEAPELAPSICRATRLPSRWSDYGSARELLASISDLFRQHLDLPERESRLLACFAISTWLADRLPMAVGLTISGPDEGLGIDVLRLLSCLGRHPLMLAELSAGSFRSLPMQISFTLLLDQQELKPNVQRLLRASRYRGLHLSGNRGSIIDIYGPKAIFCGEDIAIDTIGDGTIQVFLSPSQQQRSGLDEKAEREIANDFQPRLLMYRLKNASKAGESRIDVSQFTLAMRELARTLAACFPEDAELAHDMVQLVQPQDEEVRGQRLLDLNYAILEILCGYVRNPERQEVQVDELAKDINALLRSRGETLVYSPEKVGWRLRKLKIWRHSSSGGRQIVLGRETRQSIHRLARAYDLPYSQQIDAACECNTAEATVSE